MSRNRELLEKIHTRLSPPEFEKLVFVLFENMGFSDLELLGRSGDSGIDLRATWTQSQVPGLEIDLYFVIQVKRYSPSTTLSPRILRELRGVMMNGEWGLLVTTGRVSARVREFGVEDSSRVISIIDGSQLVELCIEYEVGVRKEYLFDSAFLLPEVDDETPIEIVSTPSKYPRDLSEILTSGLNEEFTKIGNLPLYKGEKSLVIARWSRRHEKQALNYWYGLKARDLQLEKQYSITHFAYVCAREGILLLPHRLVLSHINNENLTKTEKDGKLIHYHMKFREEEGQLIWIVSAGILENVERYLTRS